MKTLVVSLVALLFAFFAGCQNSITDPIVDENTIYSGQAYAENYADKDLINFTYPNMIKLEGMLDNPSGPSEGSVNISGVVRYGLETVYFDSPPPATQSAIKVSLKVDADLKCNSSLDGKFWIVKNTSQDFVYGSDGVNNIYYLTKTFRVQNTCRTTLDLVMSFEVTEKDLKLTSMKLKIPDGLQPIGDPVF